MPQRSRGISRPMKSGVDETAMGNEAIYRFLGQFVSDFSLFGHLWSKIPAYKERMENI